MDSQPGSSQTPTPKDQVSPLLCPIDFLSYSLEHPLASHSAALFCVQSRTPFGSFSRILSIQICYRKSEWYIYPFI